MVQFSEEAFQSELSTTLFTSDQPHKLRGLYLITLQCCFRKKRCFKRRACPCSGSSSKKGKTDSHLVSSNTQKEQRSFLQSISSRGKVLVLPVSLFLSLWFPLLSHSLKQCQFSHTPHPPPFFSLFFPLVSSAHFLYDIFSRSGP